MSKGKKVVELIRQISKAKDFGKAKADLSTKVRTGEATDVEKQVLKELRGKDTAAETSRRIKLSQAASKKEVTLPDVGGMKAKEKGSKIEFVDERTGEVFEMSKKQYDEMTPRQRIQYLNNLKARSELGEDLSDEAMAKRNKKLAAEKSSRKRKTGGSMKKTTYKKAGSSIGKKPRGCGAAQRGFGKAMMSGGRVKGKM